MSTATAPAPVGLEAAAGAAPYDAQAVWQFVRKEVDPWLVALERYILTLGEVPGVLESPSWEAREAVLANVTAAHADVVKTLPLIKGDADVRRALQREKASAKGARELSLEQRLSEAISHLDKLEARLAELWASAGNPGVTAVTV